MPRIKGEIIAKYPRHDVERSLRIPRAILEQNAGKECTERESAKYVGVGFNGPYKVELSSAIKFGFLSRPTTGTISVTERAKQALRPQKQGEEIDAYRDAIMAAPDFSDVYAHYRGENLPDRKFFDNAMTDKFGIPLNRVDDFYNIFITSLESAKLIEKSGDKIRVLDLSQKNIKSENNTPQFKKLEEQVVISSDDNCFVLMPFDSSVGDYFHLIYEPAIQKAKLVAVRADADIFGTGKIMDQVWRGVSGAKVLVADLSNRNPNVFYELGLAHALGKPVVLVSAREEDVPFDLQHIRVIYYDMKDPFWGAKLIEKVAENILSAIKNPEEATFKKVLEKK